MTGRRLRSIPSRYREFQHLYQRVGHDIVQCGRGANPSKYSYTTRRCVNRRAEKADATYTSATICFLSLSLIRSKLSSFRANIWPGKVENMTQGQWHNKLTKPSDFRLTLRIIPKEPFPIISRGSYKSRKTDAIVDVGEMLTITVCVIGGKSNSRHVTAN